MRPIKVLVVCGSGVVSSSMIEEKLKDRLDEKGYQIATEKVNPGGVATAVNQTKIDFIAYTSPIQGDYDIPAINAVDFLTGFGEEEFMAEVMKVIKEIEVQENK